MAILGEVRHVEDGRYASGLAIAAWSRNRVTIEGATIVAGRLRYFAYSDFVLLAITPVAAYKIARITFGKDGSIYVQFPYCAETQGWIGILPIDVGRHHKLTPGDMRN